MVRFSVEMTIATLNFSTHMRIFRRSPHQRNHFLAQITNTHATANALAIFNASGRAKLMVVKTGLAKKISITVSAVNFDTLRFRAFRNGTQTLFTDIRAPVCVAVIIPFFARVTPQSSFKKASEGITEIKMSVVMIQHDALVM
jgi:hypothetical protein